MYKLTIFEFLQNKLFCLFLFDVFVDQKTFEIKKIFKNFNIISLFIYLNCIDYVQILDVVINKFFKIMLIDIAKRHYIDNFEK